MKKLRIVTFTTAVAVLAALFFWTQAPSAYLQNKNKKASQDQASVTTATRAGTSYLVKKFLEPVNPETLPGSILLAAPATVDEELDDPDLPPGMAGLIDKQAYLQL